MSGIFGILDARRRPGLAQSLARMGEAMSHRPWYGVTLHREEDAGVGLGRIGIGVFNPSPQPVWNEARTASLMMTGELYVAEGRELEGREAGAGELVLDLYDRYGDAFVAHLQGEFVLVICDQARRRLLIANDRFGLYPLFYAQLDSKLMFAPEMKGILAAGFAPALDYTALAQYIRFQVLLGERTFFRGIHALRGGSLLIYDLQAEELRISRYWDPSQVPHHRPTFSEAVEESGRLLRKAVIRRSRGPARLGIYLSGGLDSRILSGMLAQTGTPFSTLTYGQKGCRDAVLARKIARRVGSQHHFFELENGQWVREHADFHLTVTEGLHSWVHAHGMSTLSAARELIDVNLTGWDGGTIMAPKLTADPIMVKAADKTALTVQIFHLLSQVWQWPGVREAEEGLLFQPGLQRRMQGRALESLREELSHYDNCRPEVRGHYFYIENLSRRWSFNMVTMARSHIETRAPFFDYDLFDFMTGLPMDLRTGQHLYHALIQRETPRLALIPRDSDQLLPTSRRRLRAVHALSVRLRHRVNRHLGTVFPEPATLYADYEAYLRTDLLDWAEAILFESHPEADRLFSQTYLKSLWNRHLAGDEPLTLGKLAPIMTYRMMLQHFLEDSTEPNRAQPVEMVPA